MWSGGRDLNLRRSGFCTLDRLNDAHHTGRLLQRLRQPGPKSGWLGSSTKLSYRPTDCYNVKITIYAFRYNPSSYHDCLFEFPQLSLYFVGFWVTNSSQSFFYVKNRMKNVDSQFLWVLFPEFYDVFVYGCKFFL